MPEVERRRRQTRLRVLGAGVVALMAGLLILRCELAGDRSANLTQAGIASIARGLDGEAGAFDEAEATLARAASLTDPYPLFALEAARRLKERRWDDATAPVQRVFAHLAAREWDAAAAALAGLPANVAGRAELARFVTELRAEAGRLAAPPDSGR